MRRFRRTSTFWHNSFCMFSAWFRLVALVCLIACFPAFAQAQQTAVPTVTFTLDFPGSEPDHYVISVSEDGQASYDSDGKLSPDSEAGDTSHLDFTMSPTG